MIYINNEEMTPEAKVKYRWKMATRIIALVLGISLIVALVPPNIAQWIERWTGQENTDTEQNDDETTTKDDGPETGSRLPADTPAVSKDPKPTRPTELEVTPTEPVEEPYPFLDSYRSALDKMNGGEYEAALADIGECLELAELDEEKAAALAQKANIEFLLEKYEDAEETYKQLLEMDAGDYVSTRSVYTMLARTQLLLEKYEDAYDACNKAIELAEEEDNNADLYAIRGVVNLYGGDVRAAKADFEQSLSEGYEDPEIMKTQIEQCEQLILAEEAASAPPPSTPVTPTPVSTVPEPTDLEINATNYYFAGNYRQAAECFEALLGNSYYFTDMQLYSNLAKCRYLLGEYEEAVRNCTLGLAEDGDSERATLHTLRGSAYMNLGENANAADDFISAIEYGASDPLVNALQACVCYYFSAEFEKSVLIGTPLIGEPGYEEAALWVGLSEYMQSQLENAAAHLEMSRGVEQDYCREDELLRLLTRCYFQLGDFSRAISSSTEGLEAADRMNPREPEIVYELHSLRGSSFLSIGEYAQAEADFVSSIEEVGYADYNTLTQLTLCCFLLGEYEPAAEYGTAAMQVGEKTSDLTYWVGLSLFSTENFEEAREVLRECYEIEPTKENIWFYIGVCSFSMEDFVPAIVEFTNSINAAEPAAGRSLYNRAICYLQLDEYEKAVEDLEEAAQSEDESISADAEELLETLRTMV